MAGTVEEVGTGVATFKAGDGVFGLAGGVGGLQGTLAEFIVVDADLLARAPKNLSMREAAALPLSTITAWEGLVNRAHVHAGQKVLIHAGAGELGILQSKSRLLLARRFLQQSLQARDMLWKRSAPFRSTIVLFLFEEYVDTFTHGDGFDIVYDTVGGATLDDSFKAVRRYTGHVLSSSRLGYPLAGASLVSRGHLLRRIYAAAVVDRQRTCAPRRNSCQGGSPGGRRQAEAIAEPEALHYLRD